MIKVGDTVRVVNNTEEIKQLNLESYVGTTHNVTFVWTDQNKQLFCTIESDVEISMSCLERI